jgi:hypothetical protein
MTEQNIQSLRCIFDVVVVDVGSVFRRSENVLHGAGLRHHVSIRVFNRREESDDRRTRVSRHYFMKLLQFLEFGLVGC